MPLMNRVQRVGLAACLTAILVSGSLVLAASIEQAAQPQRGLERPTRHNVVPTGYAEQQLGSPITIKGTWGTEEYTFSRVRVRNPSERRIESVTFVAVVQYKKREKPVIVVRGEPVAVALDPGETEDVAVTLLPTRDVLEWKRTLGTRAQAFLGVMQVTFSDGSRWMIRPREDARTETDALHTPQPYLSRALVSPKAPAGPSGALCLDDSGLSYSQGAVLPISTGKPGFALCVNGGWVEQDLGASAAPSTTAPLPSSALLEGNWLNRLVTIELKDADLPRVLSQLEERTAMKFNLLPGVSAKVTMAVRDVPARVALELIEATAGLTYRQEGQTVFVTARGAARN